MAKAIWLKVDPASGSGNGQILNTVQEYTGRVARTTIVTVQGVGVAENEEYEVVQQAKSEFVSFNNGTEMAVSKDGGQIEVMGLSNAKGLEFSWLTPEGCEEPEYDADGGNSANGINYPAAALYETYGVSGVWNPENGAAIDTDPGASNQYDFLLIVTVPANDATKDVYRTLQVKSIETDSVVAQIVLKQTAGAARLAVAPKSITIPQEGGAVSVEVTSNTTWTVS